MKSIEQKLESRHCRVESDNTSVRTARRIAAEDIREGQYVAVMQVAYEYPTFAWCAMDPISWPIDKPVRVTYLSHRDCPPVKVKSVCLPFVFCETAQNEHEIIDVRQCELAEVDPKFGETIFDCLSRKSSSDSDKSKKKKGKRRKSKRKKK